MYKTRWVLYYIIIILPGRVARRAGERDDGIQYIMLIRLQYLYVISVYF